MFPVAFPLSVLADRAGSKEWVLDPFCGRGTTNYAARALGLPSVGIDSNPVSVAIALAKLASVTPTAISREAQVILDEVQTPKHVPNGQFWELAYHPEVLRVVCRLREGLLRDCSSDERIALRAVLMGALHGPQPKSGHSYLSNQSQRTYAPKPRYAVNFWKRYGYVPPKVNVLEVVGVRAERYFKSASEAAVGTIVCGDSRDPKVLGPHTMRYPFSWIVCSPPYYGMNSYIPDQWLRHWFVGGPSSPEYGDRGDQLSHHSPSSFAEQLSQVWKNAETVSSEEATLVIRFGGINDRKANPRAILDASLSETGWSIASVVSAGTSSRGRRQAMYFRESPQPPIEEFDLWARRQA